MTENTRRPLTTKVHLYQALYLFNRGFEITLAGLKLKSTTEARRHGEKPERQLPQIYADETQI